MGRAAVDGPRPAPAARPRAHRPAGCGGPGDTDRDSGVPMSRTRALLDRLRARDPGLRIAHRAVRVTLVACTGFYTFRYGLDRPTAATYALFGAISLGLLSRIGGGARARARTLLHTLPAAYLLITLGTCLLYTSPSPRD